MSQCEYKTCYCALWDVVGCSQLREESCFIYLIVFLTFYSILLGYLIIMIFREIKSLCHQPENLKLKGGFFNARNILIILLLIYTLARSLWLLFEVTAWIGCTTDYYIYLYLPYCLIVFIYTIITYLWAKIATTIKYFSTRNLQKTKITLIVLYIVGFILCVLASISEWFFSQDVVQLIGNLVILGMASPLAIAVIIHNKKIQKELDLLHADIRNKTIAFYGEQIHKVTVRSTWIFVGIAIASILSIIVRNLFDPMYNSYAIWNSCFRSLELFVCITMCRFVFSTPENKEKNSTGTEL